MSEIDKINDEQIIELARRLAVAFISYQMGNSLTYTYNPTFKKP